MPILCASATVNMKTKYITEIATKINPFSPCAKPARLFLTHLPANARASGIAITTKLLPRGSPDPSSLRVKFSALRRIIRF